MSTDFKRTLSRNYVGLQVLQIGFYERFSETFIAPTKKCHTCDRLDCEICANIKTIKRAQIKLEFLQRKAVKAFKLTNF